MLTILTIRVVSTEIGECFTSTKPYSVEHVIFGGFCNLELISDFTVTVSVPSYL